MARREAVVIGGGIAGLCAARALVRHFSRVRVLEAEPQARLSALPLATGRLVARSCEDLERLFPGLVPCLLASGAVLLDSGLDLAVRGPHAWPAQRETGNATLFATGPLLASCLRRRLAAHRNVELSTGTRVTGLVAAAGDWPRVTGVRLDAGVLAADLVVDASGRASRAPNWIRELGLPGLAAPVESRAPAQRVVHTRWYRVPERMTRGWQGIRVTGTVGAPLLSVSLLPAERGLWALGLETRPEVGAPLDETELLAWLESLPTRHVADALRTAEPLSSLRAMTDGGRRFRHYERWPSLLGGFVALGQAVCALEPGAERDLGGSLVGARILALELGAGASAGPAFARRFFMAQAEALQPAWQASERSPHDERRLPSSWLRDLYRRSIARAAAAWRQPRASCPPRRPVVQGGQTGGRR